MGGGGEAGEAGDAGERFQFVKLWGEMVDDPMISSCRVQNQGGLPDSNAVKISLCQERLLATIQCSLSVHLKGHYTMYTLHIPSDQI